MKERLKQALSRIRDALRGTGLRRGSYSLAVSLGILALLVLLNLIIGALPTNVTRLDTTPDRRFTLTQETREILQGLQREVTLVLVAEAGTEDADLSGLLDRYEDESGYIHVRHLDPVASPAALRQYAGEEAEELESNSVLVLAGDTLRVLNYRYDIYTYSDYASYYQNYYYYGTELLDAFVAERSITSAIRYVTAPALPAAYVLTGHGEQDISALYGEISLENIRVEDLDLRTAGEVPADCAVLLVPAPQRDLSEAECAALRAYLEAGGRVLLLTQYAEGEALSRLLGLMEELWGVTVMEGTVFEGSGDHYVYYPFYLYPDLESHAITDALLKGGYRVVLPDAQGLTLKEEPPEGAELTTLLTTSEEAFSHVFGPEEDPDAFDFRPSQGDPAGPFALAVAGERTDGSRMVWLSDVYFLDSMVGEMSAGANMDLFLNALGWLADNEGPLSIREISANGDALTMTQSRKTAMTVLFVGVLPLIPVAAGIVVVTRRRRRT